MHKCLVTILGLGVLLAAFYGIAGEPKRADPLGDRNTLVAADVPWEKLENGWQRKVVFSGQLTLVMLEAPGPTSGPIELHRHVNDQVSYVVEGEIIAQVGKESRRIGKGGFFRVPSNAPHGIQILSSSVQLIDAFTPPREDFRR